MSHAKLCKNMAGCCMLHNRPEEALKYIQMALEIHRTVVPSLKSHEALGAQLAAALISAQLQQYSEAMEALKQLIALLEHPPTAKDRPHYHILMCAAYMQLGHIHGSCLGKQPDPAQAMRQLERAAAALEVVDTARRYDMWPAIHCRMLHVYRQKKEYGKGMKSAAKWLAATEQIHGPQSTTTAQFIEAIGGLQMGMGELEAAAASYLRAMQIHEQQVGTKHASTGIVYYNLSILLWWQERREEAVSMHRKFLAADINEDMVKAAASRLEPQWRMALDEIAAAAASSA